MSLGKLTLENLRLFLLLYRLRSLTEAANRLGVSLPTASRMLVRLREAFDDELFTRSASQMSPTGVARAAVGRIERALEGIESVMGGTELFSPASCRRNFRFMFHEQLCATYFRKVFERVSAVAPGVSFEMENVSDDGFNRLKAGDLDFIVFPEKDRHLASIRSVKLFDLRYAVLARKGHPWMEGVRSGRKDWKSLSDFDKVQITINSFGTRAPGGLDEWVFQGGFPRQRTAIWMPYVHAGAEMLLGGDLTMITTEMLARRFAATGKFDFLPIELPESQYAVSFMWHERSDADTALEWMRAVFVSAFLESERGAIGLKADKPERVEHLAQ